MLTYRLRPRTFRIDPAATLVFPAAATIRVHLLPTQPFGGAPDRGRTAVKSTPASAYFNANTGQHHIESRPPLNPIGVVFEAPNVKLQFIGPLLICEQAVGSLNELNDLVESLYYALPCLLNAQLIDPPFIERIDGTIGDVAFRWELATWDMNYETTTQELQEERVGRALQQLAAHDVHTRRALAAFHYFHVACRLERIGQAPGEFLAEALLNLSKVLEVLFPPAGDGRVRDAARRGLASLGYSEQEIERDFI